MRVPDYQALAQFERALLREKPRGLGANMGLLDGMVDEAIALHVWPVTGSEADIERNVRWAKAANVQKTP